MTVDPGTGLLSQVVERVWPAHAETRARPGLVTVRSVEVAGRPEPPAPVDEVLGLVVGFVVFDVVVCDATVVVVGFAVLIVVGFAVLVVLPDRGAGGGPCPPR